MPRKKKNLAVSTPKEKAWFTALYNPFTVSGLKPNTTYTSKLHVVDKLGDRTEWGKDVVFTTYPPSPVINDFNVELGRPSDKNIVVTFNLEVFSDIKNVQVITDDAQILYSEDDFGRQTEYTIKIGGLTPEKRYTVFVLVEDEYGQTTKSNFMGVTMMPEKPIITDILVVTRGQDFLELLVEYESKVSVSNYKYEVNKVTHNTNDNPYRIGGLVIGTEYPVTVTITDKNGNLSEPFTKSIITSTEGPVITKLDITSITQTSATFTVTATSKLPVKDYTFYFNNKSQTQKSNVYKATGLSPYTEYFVTVIARDELDIPSAELTKNFRTASDGIKVSSCTIDNPTKSTVNVSLKFSTVTPIESVVVFVDYGSGYVELEENPYNETDFTVYGLKPNSTIKNMKFNITNVAGEKIDYVKSNVNIALEKSNFEIVSIDVSDITQETALVSATVNSDYPIIKYELYVNDKLQETQTSLPFTLVGLTANTTYNLRLVGYDSYNNSTSKTGSFKTILELFTVGFSVGNGTEVDGIEVPSGTVINLDDYETELDGYDFLGWYIEDTKYTGNYTVTQNVVFEAKWELKQVTITYMSFDKVVKTEKVNYGGNGTPPEPEYVEGYTFVEWTPTPLNVTSDLTVTAVYEQSITEVTYDAVIEGYTAQPLKQDVPFNDKFTTGTVQIPNNERKLVNWSYLTDDFDTILYKPSTEYTMDVLYTMYLTAVYDKYKTTFNAGEGATLSGSQPSLTPVGTEITALNATLSRTGINNNKINAKLLGWSFDQAFQNIIEVGEKFEQLDSDSTINAYWEYPITYYDIDADEVASLPKSFTITSEDINIHSGISTPSKQFLGWEIYINGVKQSGTPQIYFIDKGSTGFYEFKALWKNLITPVLSAEQIAKNSKLVVRDTSRYTSNWDPTGTFNSQNKIQLTMNTSATPNPISDTVDIEVIIELPSTLQNNKLYKAVINTNYGVIEYPILWSLTSSSKKRFIKIALVGHASDLTTFEMYGYFGNTDADGNYSTVFDPDSYFVKIDRISSSFVIGSVEIYDLKEKSSKRLVDYYEQSKYLEVEWATGNVMIEQTGGSGSTIADNVIAISAMYTGLYEISKMLSPNKRYIIRAGGGYKQEMNSPVVIKTHTITVSNKKATIKELSIKRNDNNVIYLNTGSNVSNIYIQWTTMMDNMNYLFDSVTVIELP